MAEKRTPERGAGGTAGGILQFFVGFVMTIGGAYLFLDAIQVVGGWPLGRQLYSIGFFRLTSGLILIPFAFGVATLFYSARNPLGWLLTLGSLVALVFGVLRSAQFTLAGMSAFDLLLILVLLAGGLGLLLNSLRDLS